MEIKAYISQRGTGMHLCHEVRKVPKSTRARTGNPASAVALAGWAKMCPWGKKPPRENRSLMLYN